MNKISNVAIFEKWEGFREDGRVQKGASAGMCFGITLSEIFLWNVGTSSATLKTPRF